jgi:hypothetical protein
MPTIPAEASRHPHKLRDVTIQVPYTFTEGHALTAPEASFLNRNVAGALINTLGTSIRNKLAALDADRAKEFKAKTYTGPTITDEKTGKVSFAPATMADLSTDWQAEFDAKFADYAVGETNRGEGTGASNDPVASEAHHIAGQKVREAIKAKGYKISDFHAAKDENGVSKFNLAVARFIEKNDWVMTMAKRNVDERAQATASAADDLLDDLDAEPAAA